MIITVLKKKTENINVSFSGLKYNVPISREHLSESNVVKENKIKCNKCSQEYQIKENHGDL
jgi:hypothetical protein